jgi:hypothetical protein
VPAVHKLSRTSQTADTAYLRAISSGSPCGTRPGHRQSVPCSSGSLFPIADRLFVNWATAGTELAPAMEDFAFKVNLVAVVRVCADTRASSGCRDSAPPQPAHSRPRKVIVRRRTKRAMRNDEQTPLPTRLKPRHRTVPANLAHGIPSSSPPRNYYNASR